MKHIGLIDPHERTLTLKEERPDPFDRGEMREVVINTYPLDEPLEASPPLYSIGLDDEGRVRIEMEFDDLEGFDRRPNEEFWSDVEDKLGITFRDGEVKLNDNKSAANNYRDFLTFLYERAYLTEDDLPVRRPSARSRYLVNHEPKHESGEMSRSYEVAEGIYVETNLSSNDVKRNISELVEQLV